MNATIRDKSLLEMLRLLEVAAYLRSTAWKMVREEAGKFSVWIRQAAGNEDIEVTLLLDRQYRDFALRISDLLQTLAAAEQRSQLEIFSDIQTASADVVRVRFQHDTTRDGTIGLAQGVPLVENARELMLAAACATVEPRAYFASRKPDRAKEYLQQLRLGQSEGGSYVLRILSPVTPHLGLVQGELFTEPEPPFERRVTLHLLRALRTLRRTADEALSSGTLDHFPQAVQDGVSANLCTALVQMAGPIRTAGESLAIAVSWARSRPVNDAATPEVIFPGDRFPVIEEAARWFKASAPPEEAELRGAVVRLQRKDETGPPTGPVTLLAFIDGKPRKVSVVLAEADHRTALEAYQNAATVACTGQLVRAGQLYTLQNPRGFTIVPDDSGEE